MLKKFLAIGVILLFLFCNISFTTLSDENNDNLGGKTLYVGGSGPGNYTKIQDAIDDASDGDTVFVYSGTYYLLDEDITFINKAIELKGESRDNTIITSDNNSLLYISACNISISSFTFDRCTIGCGPKQIDEQNINNIKISNNRIKGDPCLIFSYCANVTVNGNIFLPLFKIGGTGIISLSSSKVDIEYNQISGFINGGGIICYQGDIVRNNLIQDNEIGILQLLDSTISNPSIISKNNFINNKAHAIFYIDPYVHSSSVKLFMKYASSLNRYEWIKNILPKDIQLPNCNNILRNVYWIENYWDDWIGFGPKLILGLFVSHGFFRDYFIPWFNFDWHPAKEPYNIQVPEV